MAYSVDTHQLRIAMINADLNTITDLSNASGVNRNTLGGILDGSVRPSSSVIERIASALALDGKDIGTIFFSQKLA